MQILQRQQDFDWLQCYELVSWKIADNGHKNFIVGTYI